MIEMHRFRRVSLLPGHVGTDGPELKQHFSDGPGACPGHQGWGVQVSWQRRNPGRGKDEAPAAGGRCEWGPKDEAAGTTQSWEREEVEGAAVSGRAATEAAWSGRAEAPGREREGDFHQNIPVQKVCLHGQRARVVFQLSWLSWMDTAISIPYFRGTYLVLLLPTVHPLRRGTHAEWTLSIVSELVTWLPAPSSPVAPCHITTSSKVLTKAQVAWVSCILAFWSTQLLTTLHLTWSLAVTLASFSLHKNVLFILPWDFHIF